MHAQPPAAALPSAQDAQLQLQALRDRLRLALEARSPGDYSFTLRTADGVDFLLTEKELVMSKVLADMREDMPGERLIKIGNVTAPAMGAVQEYCRHHSAALGLGLTKEEMAPWDAAFVEMDSQASLFIILLAASYLDIEELLVLMCNKVGSLVDGKDLQQVRTALHIKEVFTKEQEDEIQAELEAWENVR